MWCEVGAHVPLWVAGVAVSEVTHLRFSQQTKQEKLVLTWGTRREGPPFALEPKGGPFSVAGAEDAQWCRA